MNQIKHKKNYFFSIRYFNGFYLLTNLETKKVVYQSWGFFPICEYIRNNGIILDTVSLPRMSLRTFFRDYAYFEEYERKCSRL